MRFRRSIPYVVGTLFLVFATDFWLNRPVDRRLRVENVGRVMPGMTLSELEQLLGGPPGAYPTHRGTAATFSQLPCTIRPGGVNGWTYVGNAHRLQFQGEHWTTDDVDYTFYFEHGKAVGYFHEHLQIRDQTRAGLLGAVFRLPPSGRPDLARSIVAIVMLGLALIASIDFARRARTPPIRRDGLPTAPSASVTAPAIE